MIGILAYGSLIADPGTEIAAVTSDRIQMRTPFCVEFARSSRSRAGAPTLVPVNSGGAAVNAVLLVLSKEVPCEHAADMLWRRETKQVGSRKFYVPPARPGPNSVLVKTTCQRGKTILYTDFPDTGKLPNPTAKKLAALAVESAKNTGAQEGQDGITYLIDAKTAGIVTPLMASYEQEILRMTGATTLAESLAKIRAAPASHA